MKIRENINISELTTMCLGGPARYVIDVESRDEVRGAYTFAREKNLPVYVLGSGANTLGSDAGFPGLILRNRIKGFAKVAHRSGSDLILEPDFENSPDFSEDSELAAALDLLQPGETLWLAQGGETWDDFVMHVSEAGFSGVETLAAIPSTVGAAPVQNIGAYGHDVSETIFAVEVYDTADSEIKILFPSELDFGYRRSIFNTTSAGRYFIISVYFKLHAGSICDPLPDGSPAPALYNSLQSYLDENQITDFSPASIACAVAAIRADKLPDPKEIASSGSFFKNVYLSDAEADAAEKKGVPIRRTGSENKVNTGWLVEHCGLMGENLHGFKINEKAALVLMNVSATSYSDLEYARDTIRTAVREKFGIEIEQEPVELNESHAFKFANSAESTPNSADSESNLAQKAEAQND